MKRNDLRAMGLTPRPDRHHHDHERRGYQPREGKGRSADRQRGAAPAWESCITLLELLDDPEAVRGILPHASRLYCEQERRKPQEGQQ